MEAKITRRVTPFLTTDGQGVRLNRIIGSPELNHLDPFLLFDEFKSDDPASYMGGFPDHPHRGFETVTYMLQGSMRHQDNVGHAGIIHAGDVQWMSAGSGVIHSEIPQQQEGMMWGFQLWVNLPARLKMTPPRYQDYAAASIPIVNPHPNVSIRVIAGEYDKVVGPVERGPTEVSYFDVHVASSSEYIQPLPVNHNGFIYVYEGAVTVIDSNDKPLVLATQTLGVLTLGTFLKIQASRSAKMLIITAKPLNEPMVRAGPFVMNSKEEIEQAIKDYNEGHFTA